VSARVSPTDRLHAEIDQVFATGDDLATALEQVARLGAQLLLQAAVEAEVTGFLGRDRYARAASTEGAATGQRNGYCPTTVKTTAGPVTLSRPKLRGTTEAFASQLFGTGVTRTNALEALVIASFVRGLSTRDVEAALVDALGEQASVSRSTVSRICAQIKTEFEAWSRRPLDDVTLDYLFLDASHFRYHANAAAEPVLAGWGIDTDGQPVFVGLGTAASESGDACRQAAYRDRRAASRPTAAPLPALPPRTSRTSTGVYECPGCGQRLAAERRCPDCQLFARRIGDGGSCTGCGEVLTVTELLGLE
jgi:transposase-like protein